MGGKPRQQPPAALAALVVFKPSTSVASGTAIAADERGVTILGRPRTRGTHLHHVRSLNKRSLVRSQTRFHGLLREGSTWIAGGDGGIYHSSDAGESWRFEAVEAARRDRIHALARRGDELWIAGMMGALAVCRDGRWSAVERPDARFVRFESGSSLPYPRYSITGLVAHGEEHYALGEGIWQLGDETATRVADSPTLLVSMVQTAAGTQLAVGVDGAMLRREAGERSWRAVRDLGDNRRDRTYVGAVELAGGTLLVGSEGEESLRFSTDDARSFAPLADPLGLVEHLRRYRFHAAAPDGQGGALVCGWNGLVVRVAAAPMQWKETARPAPRPAAASVEVAALPVSASDASTLMSPVLAAPDDDHPRLVYADWLIDHGDPRGEFIQIQCQLQRALHGAKGYARENPPAGLTNVVELVERETALFKKHRRAWMEPLGRAPYKYWWRRGFLEGVTTNNTLFEIADKLFAQHPVTHMRVQGLSPADIRRLAETNLPGVRTLDLSRQRLTPELVEIVAGSPAIAGVSALDLWGNDFGDDGARALARRLPAKLRTLNVVMCNITDAGLEALLDAAPPSLESIQVRYNLASFTILKSHPRASLVS